MSDDKTTKQKIKEAFQGGAILTSCGTSKDYVTADLRKIISVLRGEGMKIVDKWVTSTGGKRYKEYRLLKEGEELEVKKIEAITPAPVLPAEAPAPAAIESLPAIAEKEPEPKRKYTTLSQQQLPFEL